MDERMGAVWAEYSRVKRHRDLMVENVRRRKRVAREQEATIQRLARERRELRERLAEWPVAADGVPIAVGDRVAYQGAAMWVNGVTYEVETRDFAVIGNRWVVKVGWREDDGATLKAGFINVAPEQLTHISGSDSWERIVDDALAGSDAGTMRANLLARCRALAGGGADA